MANLHDAIFKEVFGDPEHARGALQAMVPAALAAALDWTQLAHEPGSFVDEAFREQHTDLLFSARWRGGGRALLYLLFEHQSTPDSGLMAFRLLRYQVRIWERWRTEHPEAEALPVIVPLVLYHGASAWTAPRSFDALLDLPADVRPAVEPYLVRFEYLLDDLSEIPESHLRGRAMMTALGRLVAVCFKYGRTRPDLVEILARGWVDVLREVARAPNGLEALALVMRYILEVSEHVAPEALQALLAREVGPQAKETIVTAGQILVEEGRQEGRQEGKREVLLDLLRERFGEAVDPGAERRIATASAEQIKVWTRRVLSATTLAELLAD